MMIERDIHNKILPYLDSPEAIIITGMRRVGKTVLLKTILSEIISENKLYLDLENPLNQKYFEQEDFEKIKFSLETLGINFSQKVYLFLDEIQLVKQMPKIVKYMIDNYNVKFFLSGSASFYLKNLFSESLAGRKYIFELFPFSFDEFIKLKNIKLKIPPLDTSITKEVHDTVSRYYNEYVEFGGFPQVISKNSIPEKKKTINDIFSSYFQFEVEKLGDFKKVNKLRDLILLLFERIGTKLDVNKLSQILSLSRQTVNDYIAFLEGTYFIKLVSPFSTNRDVEIRKAPKIYACDSGLLNVISNVSKGILFEQNIFQSLRLKGDINYYQKKSGVEIDFVLDKKTAYEVKITPSLSDKNKLIRISGEIDLKNSRVISFNYTELKDSIYGFQI